MAIDAESMGYTAIRHSHEVGSRGFDAASASADNASTTALDESGGAAQF